MEMIQLLHTKAEILLDLARDMQRRIDQMKDTNSKCNFFLSQIYSDDRIDTCERGKKRLLESYKRVLTQIIETL